MAYWEVFKISPGDFLWKVPKLFGIPSGGTTPSVDIFIRKVF